MTALAAPVAMADRILAAAIELLTELPMSKVTMEDVARRAGIARQTVYKHFASKNDLLVALFVHEIEQRHYPVVRARHELGRSADQLTDLFVTELELALEWVLLSRTFDPASAPRIGELVLTSAGLARCMEELWLPILQDYRAAGLLHPWLDARETVRWMTYQHVWLLSHPDLLAADPAVRRHYIRTFIIGAICAQGV